MSQHPPWAGVTHPFTEYCVADPQRITIIYVEGFVVSPRQVYRYNFPGEWVNVVVKHIFFCTHTPPTECLNMLKIITCA